MLNLLLPGTPTTYYGEEIGMSDNRNLSLEQVRDKNALTPAHLADWRQWTRDPERTPMQWRAQGGGFTTNSTPWLPVHANAQHGISVEAQSSAGAGVESHLSVYRKLAEIRRIDSFRGATMRRGLVSETLYSFTRGGNQTDRYLIALDLRRDWGGGRKSYDLSSLALEEHAAALVVLVHSSHSPVESVLRLGRITDWLSVALFPGEAFVAKLIRA